MFAVAAAVLFAVGFILVGAKADVSTWIVPGFLYLGLVCLAVHALGLWPWRRPP